MEQKQKFKFAVGTTFEVEAINFDEAVKIAETKEIDDLELIPLD